MNTAQTPARHAEIRKNPSLPSLKRNRQFGDARNCRRDCRKSPPANSFAAVDFLSKAHVHFLDWAHPMGGLSKNRGLSLIFLRPRLGANINVGHSNNATEPV